LIGDVGCYSFFANKVITTGEGGMVLCKDKALMERMALLRDHGMSKQRRYWHIEAGFNYRMTNLQAALGLAQMERVEDFLAQRELVVSRYNDRLGGIKGIRIPRTASWAKNIHWLYSIEVEAEVLGFGRDQLADALRASGIETRPVFPPLHVQPAYGSAAAGLFPVSERFALEGLSLPTSNALTVESADLICDAIEEAVKTSKTKVA
jgi:perosamine synthetase